MKNEQYLKDKEVADFYGISKSTVYRWVKKGLLPKSRRIGIRTSRWKKSEIEGWKFKKN